MTTLYNITFVRNFFKFFRHINKNIWILLTISRVIINKEIDFISLLSFVLYAVISQVGFHTKKTYLHTINMNDSPFQNGFKVGNYAWCNCPFLIYKLILFGKLWTYHTSVHSNNISSDMKQEMFGFVDGFNKNCPSLFHINFEQVLSYHKLADSKCGCTCRVSKKGILERNMDWFPFGNAGTQTIILKYNDWSSLTIPGFFGVATGFKKDFVFAMNVSPGRLTKNAELASSMNRSIMQRFSSLNEIKDFVLTNPQTYSEYHITVVSKDEQFCYSFGSGTFRNEFPLYTVNFQEPERKNYSFSSPERLQKLICAENQNNLLCASEFNTLLTIHHVVADVNTNIATIKCDNGFAGDSEYVNRIEF
jgi:hypothetical protein